MRTTLKILKYEFHDETYDKCAPVNPDACAIMLIPGAAPAAAQMMGYAGNSLAGWAQYRLYQAVHNLDPKAPMRYAVKPFTSPLVGIVRVHKITIYHLPHVGFLLFGGAVVLTLLAVRRRNIPPEDTQARE